MDALQASRRLVKSPPELWAEVSDPAALARHLAEFGEIRITRVDPETTVAWEGDRASGTVHIEAAGWGTKVLLTALPTAAEGLSPPPTTPAAEEPEPEPEAIGIELEAIEARLDAVESSLGGVEAAVADEQPVAEEEPAAEAAPTARTAPTAAAAPAAPPRKGFFARWLEKRRAQAPAVELRTIRVEGAPSVDAAPGVASEIPAPPAPAPDPAPPVPTPEPTPPGPQPVPDPPAPEPDPAPPTIERPEEPPPAAAAAGDANATETPPQLDAERTVAILTGVLDDLGAAHHRPFSRG